MTTNKAMRRAQRSAQALVKGPEVFDLITSDKVRPLLVKRAERGSPPVTAISKKLVALLGPQLAKKLPVRQFAGVCVRGVLEEEGFEIADTGIRVTGDPMFRTGAVYRRVPKKEAPSESLVSRLLSVLSEAEAAEAIRLLRDRLGT